MKKDYKVYKRVANAPPERGVFVKAFCKKAQAKTYIQTHRQYGWVLYIA